MGEQQTLLQKVVDTGLVAAGGGGILNPEQADRFIDYMVDQTVLTKEVRVVRMNNATREIDRINLGTRKARKATENVDDHVDADPSFAKITLTTVKVRLDWKLTSEALEDNIEGSNLEDTVARLMATQLANDMEDLYINGDVTSADPLLKSLEGWRKLALNGAHVYSPGATLGPAGLSKDIFNGALKTMPNKYMQRRSDLRWYASTGVIQDFLNGLTSRSTPLGDAVIFGTPGGTQGGGMTAIRPFGISLEEIPLYSETLAGTYASAAGNHSYIELTFPQNRIVGIQREIKVYREFKPKVDAIEYTVFTRVCNQIENLDAWVYAKDVKIL